MYILDKKTGISAEIKMFYEREVFDIYRKRIEEEEEGKKLNIRVIKNRMDIREFEYDVFERLTSILSKIELEEIPVCPKCGSDDLDMETFYDKIVCYYDKDTGTYYEERQNQDGPNLNCLSCGKRNIQFTWESEDDEHRKIIIDGEDD